VTVNTTQPGLVGVTKEEKAAEMNRRKEERKQVSGAEFIPSPSVADNTITAYRSAEGTKSFQWEGVKPASRAWGILCLVR
jgi:hypothetical protein